MPFHVPPIKTHPPVVPPAAPIIDRLLMRLADKINPRSDIRRRASYKLFEPTVLGTPPLDTTLLITLQGVNRSSVF